MKGEEIGGLSREELQEVERSLERINARLAEISRRQEEMAASVGSGIRNASRELEEFNRKMERDTARALAGMVAGTRSAASAMRGVWQNFLQFFLTKIIKRMNQALGGLGGGGGGGFFGGLLGGILSIFGLQEGGLVKGSRRGRLFLLGENFTDELVVPLSRAGGAAPPGAGVMEVKPQVSVFPRFVIENRSPIDAEIRVYELAEAGKHMVEATELITGAEVE